MESWDFYISYTQDDRAWAEWIAWELEASGFRVLIRAWDMVPGANWVNRMQDGMRGAARTVVVLSAAYESSLFAAAEWQAAWRTDPTGVDRRLLVVRVEDCEPPGLLASVVPVDLWGVGEAAARERLSDAVAGALAGRAKPVPAPGSTAGRGPFPGALPRIWNLPGRNPHFVGRDGVLVRLADGAAPVRSLLGMGGVGKSQLAVEYAHRWADDLALAWWIPAEKPEVIPEHLAALGAQLGLGAHRARLPAVVLAELRGCTDWLVVFDNAEDPASLRPFLPSGAGQVLITTRRTGFGALGAVVPVDVFGRAESADLIRKRTPGLDDADVDGLAAALGDLPLAVEQACAYLETTGVEVPAYLELLRVHAARMLDKGQVIGRTETLATLWDLSLADLSAHDIAARQLLTVLSWLAPEPVPIDLFTNHPDRLPAPLAGVVPDPVALTDTLGALVSRSLIRRTPTGITLVHRLLHGALRAHRRPTPSEGDVPPATAQALLAADLPGEIAAAPRNWARWQSLFPHVLTVTDDIATRQVEPSAHGAWLLDRTGTYLHAHHRPFQAGPLFQLALTIDEEIHGPDHPAVAADLSNLAGALRDVLAQSSALPLLERALAIDEAHYGPDHPTVAVDLSNLGTVLRDRDRRDEALPLLERALAIDEAAYGPDHPAVAADLGNLAQLRRELGHVDSALPMLRRALTIAEHAYGEDNPALAVHLRSLGLELIDLGRSDEALPLFRRALAIAEAGYGPENSAISTYLYELSRVLGALDQPEQAEALSKRAYATALSAYDPDRHPVVVHATYQAPMRHHPGRDAQVSW